MAKATRSACLTALPALLWPAFLAGTSESLAVDAGVAAIGRLRRQAAEFLEPLAEVPLSNSTNVEDLRAIPLLEGVRADTIAASGAEARRLLSPRADRSGGLLVQDLSSNDVLFNHLAKCGGTFVKKVVEHTVDTSRIQTESDGLDSSVLRDHPFVIGLVRNPFEYYVSLWAYTSEPKSCCFIGTMTKQQQMETLGKQAPYGVHKNDAERFRKWLRVVSTEEVGLMSLRFWGSYLQLDDRVINDFQHALANDEGVVKRAQDIEGALAEFSSHAHHRGGGSEVDCFVHTEALADDLKKCLKRYEEKSSGVVDWEEFHKQMDDHHHNPSLHAKCEDLYDEEAYNFVERGDGHVLKAFNYTRCG